jgi:hypothetical protein
MVAYLRWAAPSGISMGKRRAVQGFRCRTMNLAIGELTTHSKRAAHEPATHSREAESERTETHCGSCPSRVCACCRLLLIALYVDGAEVYNAAACALTVRCAVAHPYSFGSRPRGARPNRTCLLKASRRTIST